MVKIYTTSMPDKNEYSFGIQTSYRQNSTGTSFNYEPASKTDKQVEPVKNIYDLTKDELIEVADCMIQLWINLKDNTRKHGIKSAEIFNMR